MIIAISSHRIIRNRKSIVLFSDSIGSITAFLSLGPIALRLGPE
jgi:hypothetical protein